MRLNSSTQINGERIVLVPYRKAHVPKYHRWMEDELLRQQTASERLTLHEEYEMQQSWLHDENKCTFIALDKDTFLRTNCETESMIGDANLYLKVDEDSVEELTGEIGLMVAEEQFRGKGRGNEIALCLLRYGIESLLVQRFKAVISMDNHTSLKMFEKLGFIKVSESQVFQEVSVERAVDEEFISFVRTKTEAYELVTTEANE